MAAQNRNYTPVLTLIAGVVAFVVALNFILGNPFATWLSALSSFDQPLLGALLLMLIVAVAPIVYLVSRGEGKDGGGH
ncbi:MAG TPA: hypothetical protein VKB71_19435 [Rhizomicrobium sp.]|nr:hypothetical protein [Rhizomicrobium sp.]